MLIDDRKMQLLFSTMLSLLGMLLLFLGFFRPPEGEVHSSVLVAFGEVMTFVGALMGIDYHYRERKE